MIDDFITYLTNNTESFTTIEHAWTMEPVESINDQVPALYPFRDEDSAAGDGTDKVVARMMTRIIRVQIVCRIADFDALQSELYGAALGWSAGPAFTELAPEGGNMLALKGSLFWWEERFSNRVKISSL